MLTCTTINLLTWLLTCLLHFRHDCLLECWVSCLLTCLTACLLTCMIACVLVCPFFLITSLHTNHYNRYLLFVVLMFCDDTSDGFTDRNLIWKWIVPVVYVARESTVTQVNTWTYKMIWYLCLTIKNIIMLCFHCYYLCWGCRGSTYRFKVNSTQYYLTPRLLIHLS